MCDKCLEPGMFQHTMSTFVVEKEITSENREYFRAMLDAHIKLNNPEFRGYTLRFEKITIKWEFDRSWVTGIFKKTTKQFSRA